MMTDDQKDEYAQRVNTAKDEQARAQHTPGPWTIFNHYNDERERTNAIYSNGDGTKIASVEVWRGLMPEAESEANARLIAVAPELLALLQDVGQWLEAGLSRGQISRGTANRDGDLVSQIRSVIAKAKGE